MVCAGDACCVSFWRTCRQLSLDYYNDMYNVNTVIKHKHSPRLTSPHLTSSHLSHLVLPHLTLSHLSHLVSPHLTLPHLSHLVSPHLTLPHPSLSVLATVDRLVITMLMSTFLLNDLLATRNVTDPQINIMCSPASLRVVMDMYSHLLLIYQTLAI